MVWILFERMPRKSKVQRTCTASYDVQLFALAESTKRYEEKVVKKVIIAQRGFLLLDNGLFRTYV